MNKIISPSQQKGRLWLGPFLLAFGLCLLTPKLVAAQTSTLGDVLCQVGGNISSFAELFSTIAYSAGVFFAIMGVLELKLHAFEQNRQHIRQGIMYLVAAGGLLTLPGVVGALQSSIFMGSLSGSSTMVNGLSACTPGGAFSNAIGGIVPASVTIGGGIGTAGYGGGIAASSGSIMGVTGSGAGLDGMLENIVGDIYQPMLWLLSVIGAVAGIYMIIRGLFKAAKYGTDPKTNSAPAILVNFIIGAILVSSSSALDAMTGTVFGQGIQEFSGLNWSSVTSDSTDTAAINAALSAVLAFVQLIGAISFIRGWFIVKQAVEGTGQATIPQGLTHIIGGVFAINIGVFIYIMSNTFFSGTSLSGMVNPPT